MPVPTSTNVTEQVAEARSAVAEHQYLDQSRCVDLLLDCLNAAIRPTVRSIIEGSLSGMAHVRLVAGDEFRASLDEIQLAAQVDAIFDDLELNR
jgi:hypothetical protein